MSRKESREVYKQYVKSPTHKTTQAGIAVEDMKQTFKQQRKETFWGTCYASRTRNAREKVKRTWIPRHKKKSVTSNSLPLNGMTVIPMLLSFGFDVENLSRDTYDLRGQHHETCEGRWLECQKAEMKRKAWLHCFEEYHGNSKWWSPSTSTTRGRRTKTALWTREISTGTWDANDWIDCFQDEICKHNPTSQPYLELTRQMCFVKKEPRYSTKSSQWSWE